MKPTIRKTFSSILFSFSLIMIASLAWTQGNGDCTVKLEPLSGQYHGNCQNGLAHGYGVAIGKDTYKGQFKKGLPHGQGTYIWANGNKYQGKWKEGQRDGRGTMTYKKSKQDSVVKGMWKNGQLAKELERKPYEVISKDGVDRISIYQNGDRELIEISLRRHGSSKDIKNLRLNVSSGTKKTRSMLYTIEFPSFPFKGTIQFKAPSKLQTYYKNCEVEFEINEPGRWVVEITY